MRLSRFAVHRPIFTIMVALIVIILGGVSLMRLPVDLMPDITYPTLSIITTYTNASPEEMEELITQPVEEAMSAVAGVEEVSSASTEGRSQVRVSFAWGTDLDAAANDVRDRLDRVIRKLPDDADRPMLRKFDLAAFPILILGASSDLDAVEMRRIIEDDVRYRVERVPGVASLDIWGGNEREIHVNLDPDKIKALDQPLDQIVARIVAGNVNVPAGSVDRGNYEVTVRTPGEFRDLEELRNTVVAMHKGAPVLLRDIASIDDTSMKRQRIVRVNGRPGLMLSVSKQSGTNTVAVARGVLEELQQINEDMPQIHLTAIIDTSTYIDNSIKNVGSSALYGGALAVIVLLFFLRNIRSTAIIATAIPLSIIATFALLYFGGFTLNLMTLGGLALGIGMLVDNAIVVLENVFRLREGGRGPMEAAVEGSEEVTAAIVASTLTTLAVFLPLIFVRGMAGVMFKQLAYVVSFSLACSLIVALTLVPMLSARLLRRMESLDPEDHESLRHKIFRVTGRFLNHMDLGYKHLLHWALDHRLVVVLGAIILFGGTMGLIHFIGTELMPSTDQNEVRVDAEMEVGTRLGLMDEKFRQIEGIVRKAVPEARSTVARVGGGGFHSSGSGNAQLRIALVSRGERSRSDEQIAAALRPLLSHIPGVVVRTRAGAGLFMMRMGSSGGNEKIEMNIRGHDLEVAGHLAERVKALVEDVPGVTDVVISRSSGAPEELVRVDRQKAADMKVSVTALANMLQTAISGTIASYYRQGGDQYNILVKIRNADRMDLARILDLTVTNTDGQPVVLRNVVNLEPQLGPVRIDRDDQERVISLAVNIFGRDQGSVIADINKALVNVPRPRGFSIIFGGDYEDQQKAFHELLLSIALALILVYMVMACQYESLRDPFVVMFSVPLAAIGVVLALFLTDTTFNIQSFIGCIMLAGIVVNNAILLVDHTNLLRRRDGMELRAAIEEAGRRRLRPILMTALTTILGLTPLALGLGEGGEAQAPLARAVIGGLLSSTLITLVFVPVVYSLFERKMSHAEPNPAMEPATDVPPPPDVPEDNR